jgi:hypothetical protein
MGRTFPSGARGSNAIARVADAIVTLSSERNYPVAPGPTLARVIELRLTHPALVFWLSVMSPLID